MTATNRRALLKSLAVGTAGGLLAPRLMAQSATQRPNFVVIYVDDLGYGDIEPTGGRVIRTPNLARMARQGLTLTDYYAPASLCTPSRAGFLTGRYPIRTGLARGVIMADEDRALPGSETTIAELLAPAYISGLIGKWHLGNPGTPSWPPTRHGFDLFYGIPYSHDMSPLAVYEVDSAGSRTSAVDYPMLQQQFAARAEQFLEDNRSRPFFLNLALSSPHLPNYPPPHFAGRSAAGAYGDVVEEMDDIVGRIMAKLEQLGLSQSTLVVFTSDNGPWFEGSSAGLRNRKGGAGYDGASRVPFIAVQPGTVPAGYQSSAITMGIDFLPSLCAMAGMPIPGGLEIDGRDIGSVLTRLAPSPHEELLLFNDEDVVALRTQRWKYVTTDFYRNFHFPLEGRGYPQLYDMHMATEDYSVASLQPEITRDLQQRLMAARQRFDPLRTTPSSIATFPNANVHVPEIWE